MRIVILGIFSCVLLFADSFVEAIKSGQKEGDIHLLLDYTNSSPSSPNLSNKYQKNTYLATSFGLYYHSAFYGNFRAYLGFRGAIPLIQAHKDSLYQGGKRDAARDFWQNNKAMFARSYLEYFDGDTSVKLGRLEQSSDLISKHFDGIWLQNKSLGFLLVDFIWLHQYGRVLPRELSGFEKFNTKYGGAYHLGLTLDILEILRFKVYGLTSPQFYNFLGLKANVDTAYIDANIGAIFGNENKRSNLNGNNTLLIHGDVGGNINIFYAMVGYRKSGSSAGIGNMNLVGNTFSPFFYFSGDALNYYRNVNLFYAKFGIDSKILQTYIVYGYNTFNINRSSNSNRYSQGELNLYLDWKISEPVNAIFYYLNTHGGSSAIPTINQFGLAFKLGF